MLKSVRFLIFFNLKIHIFFESLLSQSCFCHVSHVAHVFHFCVRVSLCQSSCWLQMITHSYTLHLITSALKPLSHPVIFWLLYCTSTDLPFKVFFSALSITFYSVWTNFSIVCFTIPAPLSLSCFFFFFFSVFLWNCVLTGRLSQCNFLHCDKTIAFFFNLSWLLAVFQFHLCDDGCLNKLEQMNVYTIY